MAPEKNQIHQGDCIGLLNELEPGSVDLVFADPPFNIGYDYDVYDDRQSAPDYLEWCQKWMKGVHRSLRPDGTFWLAIGDEYAAELKIEAQRIGFHCRSWVIWYYTFGVNCANGFSRSHTHLFHFVKDPKSFTFNRFNPQIRVKSARQLVYADNRANPNGRLPDNTWITRPQDAPESFGPNHDTWYFARVAGTFKEREGFHGCQMPEQLLARIIRASSHPQDLVLDPFGGSGTTLSVAKKLGRQWLGFELSSEYAAAIEQRLASTGIGDSIDGPEDPIQSAPSTARGKKRAKPFDETTEAAVIEAFQIASRGYPVDQLLCDPELNRAFQDALKTRVGRGNATVWNRFLLQLRKSGQLPPSTQRPPRMARDRLLACQVGGEIACRLMAIDYRVTLDEILCSPEFSTEFDRLARLYAPEGDWESVELRRAAVALRKQSAAARNRATAEFSNGFPSPDTLNAVDLDPQHEPLAVPGVFLLTADQDPVYAGIADHLGREVASLLARPAWQRLEIDTVSWWALAGSSADRQALKAAALVREQPYLNGQFPRAKAVPAEPVSLSSATG